MVTVLVFCALLCFVLSALPKLVTVAWVNLFNAGVAFLTAALLVSLGGATIHVG